MKGNLKIFLLLLLASPFFWWVLVNPSKVAESLTRYNTSIFADEHIAPVNEMRVLGVSYSTNPRVSSMFYNKAHVLLTQYFESYEAVSPVAMFTSRNILNIEIIPIVFVPLFLLGLLKLIRENPIYVVSSMLMLGAFAVVYTGQIVLIMVGFVGYLIVIIQGMRSVSPAVLKTYVPLAVLSTLFILGRTTWLLL